MLQAVNIQEKKKEMKSHLALNMFDDSLKSMEKKATTNMEKLTYKLAQFQVEQIRDMLDNDIITEMEVTELLMNYEQADEILNNT